MKFWLFWRRRAKSKRAGMPRGHKVVSRPFWENQPEDLSLLTSAATPIRSSRRKEALESSLTVRSGEAAGKGNDYGPRLAMWTRGKPARPRPGGKTTHPRNSLDINDFRREFLGSPQRNDQSITG
jgi:hypothetical protein